MALHDTSRNFAEKGRSSDLTTSQIYTYYGVWLIALIGITWGGQPIGEMLRAQMGKPPISQAMWNGTAGMAVASRTIVMLVAFSGLALYGGLLVLSRSHRVQASPRTQRGLYYAGLGLVVATAMYCAWSYVHTIGSV